MQRSWKAALAAALLLALVASARAERRPEDRKEATDVVTCTVKRITLNNTKFGDTGVLTTYVAEVKVDGVERAKNVRVGDTIFVEWSHVTKQPKEPIAGAYGHKYDVKEGATIRAWLIKHKDQKHYDVLYNSNGIEAFGKPGGK
jgi:hypothetical protein